MTLSNQPLAEVDPEIAEVLQHELERQQQTLERAALMPSLDDRLLGQLLAGSGLTSLPLSGILLEERDLIDIFGDDYRRYRERVSMLLPWRKSV